MDRWPTPERLEQRRHFVDEAKQALKDSSSRIRKLARMIILSIKDARDAEELLRSHQTPPHSVRDYCEQHLSCDWEVTSDPVTHVRKWKCLRCGREADTPTSAVYSPCPELVKDLKGEK